VLVFRKVVRWIDRLMLLLLLLLLG